MAGGKKSSRPGVVERVRNGVKGVKTNLLWAFQLPPERYMEREGKASNGLAARRQQTL